MKKMLIIIVVILLTVLIVPSREQMKDGGTVHYNAIVYDVYNVHRFMPITIPNENTEIDYINGIIVEVLGVELINTTNQHTDIHK